jgi:Skp family chaperone for outer membrane proteins
MIVSSRAVWTFGLGLVGLGAWALVGPALGQQSDRAVQKSATQSGSATQAAPAQKAIVPPTIGTIDFDVVFKGYAKVDVLRKEFQTAAMAKKGELMKLMEEAQHEAELLQKMRTNSEESKKIENKISELKARHEAGRESAEREFSQREAELLATIYKEIQDMVRRVAQFKGFTYVVKVSNAPVSGTDPQSVMAAMANTVIYADTRNDITTEVVDYLNQYYRGATGGAAAKAAVAAPGGTPARRTQSLGHDQDSAASPTPPSPTKGKGVWTRREAA